MRFSVIIPIYNAEKTLVRCLDSLMPQLNSNIEVLLINDGSSDSSCNICKEYISKSSSFKYFEQQNSGVSSARNKGLENATGEYILFVDSDDYVNDKYITNIDRALANNDSEMLVFGVKFFDRRNNNVISYSEKTYVGLQAVQQYIVLSKKQQINSLWNKVFSRQIIEENNLHFNPSISICEDVEFIFNYIIHTYNMATFDSVLYYVDESSTNSLSRKKRDYLCDNVIEAYSEMKTSLDHTILEKSSLKEYKMLLSRAFYRSSFACFNEVYRFTDNPNDIKKELLNICNAYRTSDIQPYGLEAIILSLPVKLKLIPIIRLLFFVKNRGRKASP